VKKYLALLKTSFQNSLAYRADFLFWGANELLDTLIFLFILITIFGNKQSIAGFTLPETVTYLIGVGLIASIIFTWVGFDLEQDIREGRLSNTLTKPMNYPLARAFATMAGKPFDVIIRLFVYLSVAFFFREKIIVNETFLTLLIFIISIFFAFIINYLINFCFGCIAFWTTTSRGMFGILRTVIAVFSGGYAPIAFFPDWFQNSANLMPFIYTRYFPMLIYLEKMTIIKMLEGIAIQIFWIGILLVFSNIIWAKGIRKYEGVGI